MIIKITAEKDKDNMYINTAKETIAFVPKENTLPSFDVEYHVSDDEAKASAMKFIDNGFEPVYL